MMFSCVCLPALPPVNGMAPPAQDRNANARADFKAKVAAADFAVPRAVLAELAQFQLIALQFSKLGYVRRQSCACPRRIWTPTLRVPGRAPPGGSAGVPPKPPAQSQPARLRSLLSASTRATAWADEVVATAEAKASSGSREQL